MIKFGEAYDDPNELKIAGDALRNLYKIGLITKATYVKKANALRGLIDSAIGDWGLRGAEDVAADLNKAFMSVGGP